MLLEKNQINSEIKLKSQGEERLNFPEALILRSK